MSSYLRVLGSALKHWWPPIAMFLGLGWWIGGLDGVKAVAVPLVFVLVLLSWAYWSGKHWEW